MGFSAMLADEYILIVPFAYHLQSGLDKKAEQPNESRNISTAESPERWANCYILSTMKIKLNWKHTLFHFSGLWMFGYAFRLFAFLTNVDAAETIRLSKSETERLTVVSLSKLNVSLAIAFFIGYVVALCLSFIVSTKFKGSYINTLIAFILFCSLSWLDWTGWNQLKTIFLLPGSLFENRLYYATNGAVLLALGLFFIFRVKGFYNKKNGNSCPVSPQYA